MIGAAWGVPEAALGCLGAGLGSSWCSWNASWRLRERIWCHLEAPRPSQAVFLGPFWGQKLVQKVIFSVHGGNMEILEKPEFYYGFARILEPLEIKRIWIRNRSELHAKMRHAEQSDLGAYLERLGRHLAARAEAHG